MNRTQSLIAGLGVFVGSAAAGPQVVRFDPDAPYDPEFDLVETTQIDATAPGLQLGFFAHDPGGGSNAEVWLPQMLVINGLLSDFEANIGPGLTGNSNYDFPNRYDELVAGDVSGPSTPGNWGVPSRDVYDGAAPDNYPLEWVAYEGFPFQSICYSCTFVEPFWNIVSGHKYVALRWSSGGETYFGWVAFSLELNEYPPSCLFFGCDEIPDWFQLDLRYAAFGWETEPDTPITVGGGLCPADVNFDGQVNFFDVSFYLSIFTAGSLGADLDDNGVLNFFDISEFIGRFSEVCTS